MQLISLCKFRWIGKIDVSEGQTQYWCTLRGAIHVILLLASVTDLRPNILVIKINVLEIPVLFLTVQDSSNVSNNKMIPVWLFKKQSFSLEKSTVTIISLIQLLILKGPSRSYQYFLQSHNTYEVEDWYAISHLVTSSSPSHSIP